MLNKSRRSSPAQKKECYCTHLTFGSYLYHHQRQKTRSASKSNAGESLETSEFSCTYRSSPFLLISWTLALQTSAWARKSIWRSCYGGRHVHQNGQQTGSFVGCRLGRSSLCAKCMSIAWQVELTNRSSTIWDSRFGFHAWESTWRSNGSLSLKFKL